MTEDIEPVEEHTPSEDLDVAKASFWKSAAKLAGALSIAVVPAFVSWLDSKTEAIDARVEAKTALTAAATEKATNDVAYQALVDRIDGLEMIAEEMGEVAEDINEDLHECNHQLIRLDERVESLRRRHGFRERVAVADAPTPASHKPKGKLAELLMAAKRKKPLAKERPRANPEQVQMVQEAYEDGEF